MENTPRRVLIVEDDLFLRKACTAILRNHGWEVLTAGDGKQGLAMARAERPAVVLLDLLLPTLPGAQVLAALKADPATHHMPVLVLSNSSRAEDRQAVIDLGAAGYFVKANLSLAELVEAVNSLYHTAA